MSREKAADIPIEEDILEKEVKEDVKGEACASEKDADEKNVTSERQDEMTEKKNAGKEAEEDVNTKYLRLMADFQNYKRRTEKEKSDIYAYANEKLVGELLDVIDNFERALSTAENVQESFATGMNMIFTQFIGVLEKIGLEEVKALGEDFDPNFHNAVMTEDSDELESGKVTAVLQKGYMLNKKVIRPTMVKVAN